MTATTQILPFVTNAAGSGGNRLSPTAYAALTALLADGFESGAAQSVQVNTVLAQATFMGAGLAGFCVAQGISVPDDGNLSNLVTEITQAIQGVVSASLSVPNIAFITTSGTYTIPAGCAAIKLTAWGAGGGGGAGYTSSYYGSGAGGGGCEVGRFSVTPGTVYTTTIGNGGSAGVVNSTNGGNGGTTSFGALLSATGGTGGQSATSSGNGVIPGPGGSGSGGFTFNGQVGSNAAAGINGFGGASYSTFPNGPYTGAGVPGQIYGQGGSGGGIFQNGGAGANGLIIVEHLP